MSKEESNQELAAYIAMEQVSSNIPLHIIKRNLKNSGMTEQDAKETLQSVVDKRNKK